MSDRLKIIRPEELIADDFLAVTIAEVHVTDHQDSVEDNSQRNDPKYNNSILSCECKSKS